MRYEFNDDSIHIENARPETITSHEKQLAKKFIEEELSNEKLPIAPCIISQKSRSRVLFSKWNVLYAICDDTWTVSLGNYPDSNITKKYFYTSELAKYRASKEYQQHIEKTRLPIWQSQVEWIEGRINRYLGNGKYNFEDWGSKWQGWTDLLQNQQSVQNLFIKNPLPPIVENESKDQVDVISLIEVIQRERNPDKLLHMVNQKLKNSGLLIITVRSGSGFDILTLKDEASIFPLDHIILPSPEGLQILLERNGFEILEISTPGLLDVEYVGRKAESIPANNDFIKYLFSMKNEKVKSDFQAFLQRNNLSSHIRVVARKKG